MASWAGVCVPCSDERPRPREKETEAMRVLTALQIVHREQRELKKMEIHGGSTEQRLCIFLFYHEEEINSASTEKSLKLPFGLRVIRHGKAGRDKSGRRECEGARA